MRISRRHGYRDFSLCFVVYINSVFKFQHITVAIIDDFKAVIINGNFNRIIFSISDGKARSDATFSIFSNAEAVCIFKAGQAIRIAADNFRNIASVRARPGKLKRLRTTVFEVTHFDIVRSGV